MRALRLFFFVACSICFVSSAFSKIENLSLEKLSTRGFQDVPSDFKQLSQILIQERVHFTAFRGNLTKPSRLTGQPTVDYFFRLESLPTDSRPNSKLLFLRDPQLRHEVIKLIEKKIPFIFHNRLSTLQFSLYNAAVLESNVLDPSVLKLLFPNSERNSLIALTPRTDISVFIHEAEHIHQTETEDPTRKGIEASNTLLPSQGPSRAMNESNLREILAYSKQIRELRNMGGNILVVELDLKKLIVQIDQKLTWDKVSSFGEVKEVTTDSQVDFVFRKSRDLYGPRMDSFINGLEKMSVRRCDYFETLSKSLRSEDFQFLINFTETSKMATASCSLQGSNAK